MSTSVYKLIYASNMADLSREVLEIVVVLDNIANTVFAVRKQKTYARETIHVFCFPE